MVAKLSYNGAPPRLFHNEHHIHFGNEKELMDDECGGLYTSISQKSYKDLSTLNKDHKIFSVHEKKRHDPKKITLLEHYDGKESTHFNSVQKNGNPNFLLLYFNCSRM